ncbi:MAG TPA: cysteine-rich CWC family protein [Tepidisphaeraceae bacterium]|nr:cysteine-rich CWC family protein [Tepidisphaeraceae bacterium]
MTSTPDNRVCPRCGTAFHCGSSTGACWCAAMPPVMPVPQKSTEACLCRACLRAEMQRRAAAVIPKQG